MSSSPPLSSSPSAVYPGDGGGASWEDIISGRSEVQLVSGNIVKKIKSMEDIPQLGKSFSIKGEFSKSMGSFHKPVPKNDAKAKVYWYYRRKELKAMKNYFKSLSSGSNLSSRGGGGGSEGPKETPSPPLGASSPIPSIYNPPKLYPGKPINISAAKPLNSPGIPKKENRSLLQHIEQQEIQFQQQHKDQLARHRLAQNHVISPMIIPQSPRMDLIEPRERVVTTHDEEIFCEKKVQEIPRVVHETQKNFEKFSEPAEEPKSLEPIADKIESPLSASTEEPPFFSEQISEENSPKNPPSVSEKTSEEISPQNPPSFSEQIYSENSPKNTFMKNTPSWKTKKPIRSRRFEISNQKPEKNVSLKTFSYLGFIVVILGAVIYLLWA